jgi:hypothetical protein
MRDTVIRKNSVPSACAMVVIGTAPRMASISNAWRFYGQLQLSSVHPQMANLPDIGVARKI